MIGLGRRLASKWPARWLGGEARGAADRVPHVSPLQVAVRQQEIHPRATFANPLPRNVTAREDLPADAGWWGFSFRDVPARESGATFLATIRDCRIIWYHDPARANDFYPAVVTGDGRAIEMRELRFRPPHAQALQSAVPPVRLRRATWFIERVYHNHSHWLTAHLPKVLLLRERGQLSEALLPSERPASVDASLAMLGIDPGEMTVFDFARPLQVEELTVVGTDRFRPELLGQVAAAFRGAPAPPARRRLFISRQQAARRRLLNEDEVWPLFRQAGFERVCLEALPFAAQVGLMREAEVIAGPHGAGLTNMLFCPPGTEVMEIADLDFPNPNFYAQASALGHHYWRLGGHARGDGRPIDRDLYIDPARIAEALSALPG